MISEKSISFCYVNLPFNFPNYATVCLNISPFNLIGDTVDYLEILINIHLFMWLRRYSNLISVSNLEQIL
jgi:hypothetical protein